MDPQRFRPVWLLGLLVIAACSDGGTEDSGDATDEDTPPIPVETTRPTRGDIAATYSGSAPIEAFQDALVIAKVRGEVRQILAEEGDDVTAGQVIARLDGDRLRLAMQEAQAKLQKLQRDYQRNVDLKEKSLISDGDFEKISFEMDALQAEYDLAKLEFGYTEIRAPISGVVSERLVKLGNTIDVNAPLFEITSLEPLISYLHVPEREYRRIERGQGVSITVDALHDAAFEGVVARVSPVVDPQTGTFKITIEVSDETRRLKPGMFGRASIVHDVHGDALQLPRGAVIDTGGETSVFIIRDSIARRMPVATGYAEHGRVEILSGIADTDEVVIVGQNSLKDGTRVSVIETSDRGLREVGGNSAGR